jgi:hypothetical protein
MAMNPGTGRIQNRIRRYFIAKNGEPVHIDELKHAAYGMFGDRSHALSPGQTRRDSAGSSS